MGQLYRRVEIVDGETTEPVHYVGVHPITWMNADRKMIEPIVAFVESDEAEKLLRKIRDALIPVPHPWDIFVFNNLIREIDALLGDEAENG